MNSNLEFSRGCRFIRYRNSSTLFLSEAWSWVLSCQLIIDAAKPLNLHLIKVADLLLRGAFVRTARQTSNRESGI